MLVVRRRAGEAIVVGTDIEIEVVEISRTRVKLGVRAPRNMLVMRRETSSVAAENREAPMLATLGGGLDNIVQLLRKGPGCP